MLMPNLNDQLKGSIRIDDLEYWHDVLCSQVFQGECSNAGPGFNVALWAKRIDNVQFSVITSSPHSFQRYQKHVRHAPLDEIVFTLHLSGDAIYQQDGRELILRPGDLTCGDSTRPIRQQFVSEASQIVVQIPRQLLLAEVGGADRYIANELGQHRSWQDSGFVSAGYSLSSDQRFIFDRLPPLSVRRGAHHDCTQ